MNAHANAVYNAPRCLKLAHMGGSLAPIGNASTAFTGLFNGNGYSISSLAISATAGAAAAGVFGVVRGTVANLVPRRGHQRRPRRRRGGVVGALEGGAINNTKVMVDLSLTRTVLFRSVGGLVGDATMASSTAGPRIATITDSQATGTINDLAPTL